MSVPAPLSAIDVVIAREKNLNKSAHEHDLYKLAVQVQHNLQFQHDWTALTIHVLPSDSSSHLSRPMISGFPPRRVYIHPDEQIELIRAGIRDEDATTQREWVLPSYLGEDWSLKKLGHAFDNIEAVPPTPSSVRSTPDNLHHTGTASNGRRKEDEAKWRKSKRLLLATVEDDSTVVYYVVHDGIVKPRQN